MSDAETRYHEHWLGLTQPHEGLLVSVPVLVDAQCVTKLAPETHARLRALCPPRRQGADGPEGHAIASFDALARELFEWDERLVDRALPDALAVYADEGRQTIRPTFAIRNRDRDGYLLLVWDLADEATGAGPAGVGLALDAPEAQTGPWPYPPAAKLDRLLRHARVPIGVLTNREVVRVVYAPHGESSGHIDFRVGSMAQVGGRPILDALVMLLHARRLWSGPEDKRLPALLRQSRERQANVTTDLAAQVFDALAILLRGFEAAAERDRSRLLDEALAQGGDHLYRGLLTVLLRLVFLLYAEDRALVPVEHPVYGEHYSVLGLFARLSADADAHPDSMHARFGAWGQLVSIFRAVFLGVHHGDLQMPARRGALFDPNVYPFLEGWGPSGAAPIVLDADRAAVRVPTIDDETVLRVLERLLVFEGQRLSYSALDVEQIGSIYEALMGYHVVRVAERAVCLRPSGVWVTPGDLLQQSPRLRAKWLKEEVGLSKAQAETLNGKIEEAEHWHPIRAGGTAVMSFQAPSTNDPVLEALSAYAQTGKSRDKSLAFARAGQLVLQPGSERRRTSSHYTPRSLTAPIVERTLAPLLSAMGEAPASEAIVELKVCDPAMGSGAFLVETCRYLGDQLVAAWTREGRLEAIAAEAPNHDPVLHARRVIAQRCLYGVDRNAAAVELAKLSLWLFTLAKDLPFSFVDHALRHGDSLVGLSFDQLRAFHWELEDKPKKGAQLTLDFARNVLAEALSEAIEIRKGILALARDGTVGADVERRLRMQDAQDASERARILGDLVVGAFFSADKPKAREEERKRRRTLAERWIRDGDEEAKAECERFSSELRARLPVFHWMLEYPEVFYAARPDPLDGMRENHEAFMEAFVGNPPFAGKNAISDSNPESYLDWLMAKHPEVKGRPNTDLSAYFFRRAAELIGGHGTIGLIATNTIAQGDSRLMALKALVERGWSIHAATSSFAWPGQAAVTAAVVHLALGTPSRRVSERSLDGRPVEHIDSRLRPKPERPEPVALASNASRAFMGGKLVGIGLAVDKTEYASLIATDPRNADILRPYLGGEEVNSNPDGSHDRHVIDFTTKSLAEASQWPSLLRIVEERVKPARMSDKRGTYKTYWWRPGESGGALHGALADLDRCLVASRVTKHLCFTVQSTAPFFAETLYAFALAEWTAFAVLQSRIHEPWARLLSSSMKTDLRYAASDCFETFPFPAPDPRTVIPALETIGQALYDARAKYMLETQQGLTQTYNRLKDPACTDPPIVALRAQHEAMDRAVLEAYAEHTANPAWLAVPVPPFCPATDEDRAALAAFNDHVIDLLFALNAERAEEEAKQGLKPGKKQGAAKKKATGKRKPKKPGQGSLDIE